MGTFTQFICIADGYCVLSEWSGKTGRGNIGKLAESVCLHLVASIAELVDDLTFTFLGIALIVWIGIVTYLMDYYRNRQMGVEYGSEQWADLKQIQRNLMNKDQTKNTLLSKNVAVDNGKLSNMNLLILGGSGSYKSTSLVIPNILLASMTNVVLDIKGELLRKTGNYLKEKHIAVKVLNLINPEESDRWNPFVYIRDEVGLVKLITNLQESVKPPDAMKGEPFWDQAVSLYLMSLFSYEWLRQEREKKEHPEQYQALHCHGF